MVTKKSLIEALRQFADDLEQIEIKEGSIQVETNYPVEKDGFVIGRDGNRWQTWRHAGKQSFRVTYEIPLRKELEKKE